MHFRIFVKGSWILLDTEFNKRPVVNVWRHLTSNTSWN